MPVAGESSIAASLAPEPSISDAGTGDTSATRKSKGGYLTTIQPKLHNSVRKSSTEAELEDRLELIGRESDARTESKLLPRDGGFGAWSYVVSAFAMFIVVWGMYSDCQ